MSMVRAQGTLQALETQAAAQAQHCQGQSLSFTATATPTSRAATEGLVLLVQGVEGVIGRGEGEERGGECSDMCKAAILRANARGERAKALLGILTNGKEAAMKERGQREGVRKQMEALAKSTAQMDAERGGVNGAIVAAQKDLERRKGERATLLKAAATAREERAALLTSAASMEESVRVGKEALGQCAKELQDKGKEGGEEAERLEKEAVVEEDSDNSFEAYLNDL